MVARATEGLKPLVVGAGLIIACEPKRAYSSANVTSSRWVSADVSMSSWSTPLSMT